VKYHIKNQKTFIDARYTFFKFPKVKIWSASLPHSLTDHGHKPRGQTKQHMAPILCHNNILTGVDVPFWVLTSMLPLRLVFSAIFH